MKSVEEISASCVADAFHLSQRESECKSTFGWSTDLSLSPWRHLMPRVEVVSNSSSSVLPASELLYRQPPVQPWLLAVVLMPVMEKIKPQLPPQYVLGMGRGMEWGWMSEKGAQLWLAPGRECIQPRQESCRLQSPVQFTSQEPPHSHWEHPLPLGTPTLPFGTPTLPFPGSQQSLSWSWTRALWTPSDTFSCFLTIQHPSQCIPHQQLAHVLHELWAKHLLGVGTKYDLHSAAFPFKCLCCKIKWYLIPALKITGSICL